MKRDQELLRQFKKQTEDNKVALEKASTTITELKDYGHIPQDVDSKPSRGAQAHQSFLNQMWKDAKSGGHIIDQLNKALAQERTQNGVAIKEIMKQNPKETPCAEK